MKVTGPGQVQSTAAAKKKNASGSGFKLDASADSAAPAALSGAGPLAALSSILALQEVEDPTSGRRRAVAHAQDLLDRLEEIRAGLLTGTISESKLRALTLALRDSRIQTADPRLDDILSEIELRAEVELAKLESRG